MTPQAPAQLPQPSNGHVDLRSLSVAPPIKFLIQHGDTIGQYPSRSEALSAVLLALLDAGYRHHDILRLCLLEEHGISELPREKGQAWLKQEVMQVCREADNRARQAKGDPEDWDEVLNSAPRTTRPIVQGLLHGGMVLFGGKPKRGKSWLMLDLAMSVATGGHVWRHFPVHEPQPVLYMALEDDRDLVRDRLQAIQPGVKARGTFQFLYHFPRLNEGGLERLRGYAESGRYRLIVIDVLARVESSGRRGSDKSYHDIYEMLSPLQDLRRQYPLCLVLVTHLRKAEAQEVFDGLHGSVAYQGLQDSLWVLERPLEDTVGTLHTLGKRGHRQVLHVSLVDGHWEFLGYGEEVQLSQARQAILELFEESDKTLTIDDVLKGLSRPRDRYQTTKRTLGRMVQEEQIVRLGRGRYALTRGQVVENRAEKKGAGDSWGQLNFS
jgi:hypothetical protein